MFSSWVSEASGASGVREIRKCSLLGFSHLRKSLSKLPLKIPSGVTEPSSLSFCFTRVHVYAQVRTSMYIYVGVA